MKCLCHLLHGILANINSGLQLHEIKIHRAFSLTFLIKSSFVATIIIEVNPKILPLFSADGINIKTTQARNKA